jgi:hypothetical protein
MHPAADIQPERPRLARRLMSWLALLLLAGHLAAAGPRLPAPDSPDRPLSIEARPIQAIVAQGRIGDVAKAGRLQAPDKPGQGSGDPPVAGIAPAVALPSADVASVYAIAEADTPPSAIPGAYRARAPPLA